MKIEREVSKEELEVINKANEILAKIDLEIGTINEIGGTNPPTIKDEK